MKLCFDTVEELRDFVKNHLKGQRGAGKDRDDSDNSGAANTTGGAPAPLMPPAGQPGFMPPQAQPTFVPPQQQAGFPGASGGVQIDPGVAAIVTRIANKMDSAIAGGQPVDQVLNWFRQQLGAETSQATLDQIKQSFLPKAPMKTLENIAALMNC